METGVAKAQSEAQVRTFLIADIRNYTEFTVERGDEAAAKLAHAFAQIASTAAMEHEGRLIETRGDEVLLVFASARQSLRAALSFQRKCADHEIGPGEPLPVGIGLDAGEAVALENGYRGASLNLAARLCALSRAGQVLASETVVNLARRIEGIGYVESGSRQVKGFSDPIKIFEVLPTEAMPRGLATGENVVPGGSAEGWTPNNLTDAPTSFIGRAKEIAEISSLLNETAGRLVTLTGPGGVGKTRLAVEVARAALGEYRDGVFLVPLASLVDSELVLPALARTLGLSQTGREDLSESLREHLRGKQVLLVLDNFEQLLDAAASITDLLESCEGLRALVTSRARLHISREREYQVRPLDVPDIGANPDLDQLARFEAFQLLMARSQEVNSEFVATEENAPALQAICARLDGLPLAIELAAGRTKLLSAQALLRRLENSLNLLTGGARDLPTRQQTLRATIDFSYALLTSDEQALLARLSTFVGDFNLEAAEEVCGGNGTIDVMNGTESLVDKSLVQRRGGPEPRFFLLETIREYAAEKLNDRGETEAIKGRHSDYFAQLVLPAEAHLRAEREAEFFEQFDADRENIRAAIEFDRFHRPARALLMGFVLHQYWIMRAEMRERVRWIEDAYERNKLLPPAERLKVLQLAVHLSYGLQHPLERELFDQSIELREALGDITGKRDALERRARELVKSAHPEGALKLYEQSRTLQKSREWPETLDSRIHYIDETLVEALITAQAVGDYTQATELAEEGLALSEERKYTHDVARFHSFLGWLSLLQGDLVRAEGLLQKALGPQRTLADKNCMPASLMSLAILSLERGNPAAGEKLAQEGLGYVRELQQAARMSEHLSVLGRALLMADRLPQAAEKFAEARTLARQSENLRAYAEAIWGLAAVEVARSDWKEAMKLAGLATSMQELATYQPAPIERKRYDRLLETCRAHLDETNSQGIWEQGFAMAAEELAELGSPA